MEKKSTKVEVKKKIGSDEEQPRDVNEGLKYITRIIYNSVGSNCGINGAKMNKNKLGKQMWFDK